MSSFVLDLLLQVTYYPHSMSRKRAYYNIWHWMELTGTTQATLSKLAKIKPSMLSQILSGGKRCSLEKALRLMYITDLPVQNLFDKSKYDPRTGLPGVSTNKNGWAFGKAAESDN